jgi:hypothetical protein
MQFGSSSMRCHKTLQWAARPVVVRSTIPLNLVIRTTINKSSHRHSHIDSSITFATCLPPPQSPVTTTSHHVGERNRVQLAGQSVLRKRSNLKKRCLAGHVRCFSPLDQHCKPHWPSLLISTEFGAQLVGNGSSSCCTYVHGTVHDSTPSTTQWRHIDQTSSASAIAMRSSEHSIACQVQSSWPRGTRPQ